MSNSLTWLHISDLHLCEPKTGWDAARVLQSLKDDLQKMESKHELHPDLVFFTGDVAFGQFNKEQGGTMAEQYEAAAQFFDGIRSAFTPEIPKDHFFIVPGNHDVNRDLITPGQTQWLDSQQSTKEIVADIKGNTLQWQHYMARLGEYRAFLERNGYQHLLSDPTRLIYSTTRDVRNIKVGITGFNSAWSCGRNGENGKLWMAGHWQIENLYPKVSSTDLKIALIHHPPSWFVEYEKTDIDRNIERDYDFCLHGHEHQDWVEDGTNHIRIAAGACYDDSRSENGYNFVRLDLQAGTGEVWLRRYERRGAGWVADIIANRTESNGVWPLKRVVQLSTSYEKESSGTGDIQTLTQTILSPVRKGQVPIEHLSDPPPVIGAWVGRGDELKSLKSMSNGVVAITGIGGQGKSSLVSKFLEDSRSTDPNRFWDWRDCREESERFHTQLIALIERFSGGELTGEHLAGVETKDVIRYFFQKYSDRPGIFVLDNVDHYVDIEEEKFSLGVALFVNEALRVNHNFLVILTCRPRVTYPSARFIEVHLPGLSHAEAVELFRARSVKMEDKIVQDQVYEIWDRTGGHPFWLDLIAIQMERNPSKASNIVEELRKGQMDDRAFAMFKALWKGLHPHQHTVLRCMAEMNYAETQESIKYLSNGLGVSPKHFRKAFNGLQTLSLLVERKSGVRESKYDLHPLVRSFVVKEFPSNNERLPFIQSIIRFIDRFVKGLASPADTSPLDVIEKWVHKSELEANGGDYVASIESLVKTGRQLTARGMHEELFRVGKLILDKVNWSDIEIQELDDFHDLVHMMITRLAEQNRKEEARYYLESYEKSVQSGTVPFIRYCNIACYFEWLIGNYYESITWGRRGVNLRNKSHVDTHHDPTHNLALSLRDSGQLDEALQLFAPDIDVQDILSDDHMHSGKSAAFYGNIGRCLQFKGV